MRNSGINSGSETQHPGASLRFRIVSQAVTPFLWGVLAVVILWSYGGVLVGLAGHWWTSPDYQHCFLVPIAGAYLLWHRRDLLPETPRNGSSWGFVLLGLAAVMRWAAEYFYYSTLDPLSLLPCLGGVALLWAGLPGLRWTWPAILFLVFMIPVPGTFAGWMSQPLQRIGTTAGTYLIQTLGIPAVAHGNVIALSDGSIGVVEACSGLKMLMVFFAVCTCAVLVLPLRWIDKLVILLSAAPIAVIANIFRITVTAVLHDTVGHELADRVFHDMAGLLMMPLALILIFVEIALLRRIFLEPTGPMALDGPEVRDEG